jgi:hypothetical protein
MFRFARLLSFVVLASFALFAAGCKSNNEGKIVGKWKVIGVSGPNADPEDFAEMQKFGVYLFLDFRVDGVMVVGIDSDNPEKLNEIKQLAPGGKLSVDVKYKLRFGDGIEFYDLPAEMQEQGGGLFGRNKDRALAKVKINGDQMTMTDDDGTSGQLVRVK